ncbi:MAG: InlB B-repeat-containing protein [Spirochaetales bacterium]|nr:InlB B-repeat-containing protein [Spirochaetales bacterium]
MKGHGVYLVSAFFLVFGVLGSVFLSGCILDLDPSKAEHRKAVVTFTIPDSAAVSSSRALASDQGFLYIQTGYTAETAVLYGPYTTVFKSVYRTVDILAGSYPYMALIYLPSLPKTSLTAVIPAATDTESLLQSLRERWKDDLSLLASASAVVLKDITLEVGTENAVSAVLIPATTLTATVETPGTIPSLAPGSGGRFIRLSGLVKAFETAPAGSKRSLVVELVNQAETSVELESLTLFDALGRKVSVQEVSATVAVGASSSVSFPWSGMDVCFILARASSAPLKIVLSAQYTIPVTRTLSFDSSGGSGGPMAALSLLEGSSTTLPSNVFTRAGYTFAGWATVAGATTPVYADGGVFTMANADVILYAVWVPDGVLPVIIDVKISGGTAYTNVTAPEITMQVAAHAAGIKTLSFTGVTLGSLTVNFNGTNLAVNVSGTIVDIQVPPTVAGTFTITGCSFDMVEGVKLVTVTAIDSLSNISLPKSTSITLDMTAPTMPTIVSYPSGVYYDGSSIYSSNPSFVLPLSSSDAGSGIQGYGISTGGPWTATVNLTAPSTTSVYCADIAGNVSPPLTLTIIIDMTSPFMQTPSIGMSDGIVGVTLDDAGGSGIAEISYRASEESPSVINPASGASYITSATTIPYPTFPVSINSHLPMTVNTYKYIEVITRDRCNNTTTDYLQVEYTGSTYLLTYPVP